MDNDSQVPMPSGAQEQAIREAAYYKWEQAGRPYIAGVVFWLEAESEFWSRHEHEAIDSHHALIVRPKALPKPAEKRASRKQASAPAYQRP